MLSYADFKAKLVAARTKALAGFTKVQNAARDPRRKLTRSQQKRSRRMYKTRARVVCDSFRWRHAHQHHPSGRLNGRKGKQS